METIAAVIESALYECYERGVINWSPSFGAPESFEAECEIEYKRNQQGGIDYPYAEWLGDVYFVTILGVFCVIDGKYPRAWHASRLVSPDLTEWPEWSER